MEPIGHLRSCFTDKFATPRQSLLSPSSWAYLEISANWQPELSLAGIEDFSHIWLIFEFHLNSNKVFRSQIRPPRLGGQKQGVFATRSPHHPNSLGLSLVRLEERTAQGLYLSGVDLVDGTPVLDIKPYLRETEALPDAKGGWVDSLKIPEPIQVSYTPEAKAQILDWEQKSGRPIQRLLGEILREDPRPVHQRGETGKSYGFCLIDREVRFHFLASHHIEVIEVLDIPASPVRASFD